MRRSLTCWIAAALIALATLAAHAPILRNAFVSFDDGVYVLENDHVRGGLTPESMAWALTATYAGNWHPVAWLSHMLDWDVWGRAPAGHHATSLVLHTANVLLLFILLRRMTGSIVRSAVVAALFGVHPLQVETVAWVAERKSLLCTLFWWLAMLAYVRWSEAPTTRRYAGVVACSALALASKPMAVTLPFTLLLLDAWPLGRLPLGTSPRAFSRAARRLVSEKSWLFVLSAASCAVTLAAEHSAHGIRSLQRVPWSARVSNALVGYASYLVHAVWPRDLSVYYPHPGTGQPWGNVAASALLLGAVSWLAWRQRARRPYVTVGWAWYLGTLVPVIGLVQVGSQAMADRYAYVPLVGIFVIAAWGVPDLASAVSARLRGGRSLDRDSQAVTAALAAAAGICIVVLAARTRVQTAYWRDTRTLFEHALAITGDNAVDHVVLGLDDAKAGRLDQARRHYEVALRSDPNGADIYNNLGNVLAKQGNLPEAIASFESALRLRPDYGMARANLAAALLFSGRPAEAWRQVALARKVGFEPPADLVRELASTMPEPVESNGPR